ncbi:hypothetical protein JCGZ_04799 [Jatropha curcas]|uniref:ENTH domain-containing protein n=1 Tax=Jatropha curcas TaxID=180498 RepID=A0A067KPL6_JATCU|nr:putative clathrin assembly protein At2g25430 [Jatropha curcas]KDP38156.1 hypothetical protein JCGZ_04799 [Jatropha curcas]
MHRRVKQVLCALKEHSSLSYAKIVTFGGFCDIDLTIVKATSPDDLPVPEKYIRELLKIFSISPPSFHSFSLSFTRRFGRTRSWKVALKCLLLLHRLLRSLPENSPFRAELLWARSNGFLSLYPCQFRDDSSSNPEDYTLFIRSYAQLLDEALHYCFSLEKKIDSDEKEEEIIASLPAKIKQVNRNLEILQQLQSLIDRVMDCRPTDVAARSFIVQSAMKHIIRESFVCYTTFKKDVVLVLDSLMQMPYRSCLLSFSIYKKAALQAEQLCEFFDWCKGEGLCGSYEYPFIERIPEIQIKALENFLNGMWQLTEPSSSSATSPGSWVESHKSSSSEEDERGDHHNNKQIVVSTNQWVTFDQENTNGFFPRKLEEKLEELMEPLIKLEEGESDNWEALLDASIDNCLINPNGISNNGYEHGKEIRGEEKVDNQWQMQVYNPFCQPYNNYYNTCMSNCNRWPASNPAYQWG